MKHILTAILGLTLSVGLINCARDDTDLAERDMMDEDVTNMDNENLNTVPADQRDTNRVDTSLDVDPDRQPDIEVDTRTAPDTGTIDTTTDTMRVPRTAPDIDVDVDTTPNE